MKIGIDIDGVLNYAPKIMLECGTKYCVETGLGKLLDPGAHDLTQKFSWDTETARDFWVKYAWRQVWEDATQDFAAEVIDKLREDGHEIWIVTGRANSDRRVNGMLENETWEDVTKKWLAREGIHYDEFGFDQQDKGSFCREHGIEVMVEDSVGYLKTFDGQTKVLIFDYPYNREVDLSNAERVYSWYDIYAKVKGMM